MGDFFFITGTQYSSSRGVQVYIVQIVPHPDKSKAVGDLKSVTRHQKGAFEAMVFEKWQMNSLK
jgi:hypothetical protein